MLEPTSDIAIKFLVDSKYYEKPFIDLKSGADSVGGGGGVHAPHWAPCGPGGIFSYKIAKKNSLEMHKGWF